MGFATKVAETLQSYLTNDVEITFVGYTSLGTMNQKSTPVDKQQME